MGNGIAATKPEPEGERDEELLHIRLQKMSFGTGIACAVAWVVVGPFFSVGRRVLSLIKMRIRMATRSNSKSVIYDQYLVV